MSLKSEKLSQRIQEFQKFVAARIDQDVTYAAISEELEKIADSLKAEITIQIFSKFPVLAQALQRFLSTEKILPLYQFKISSFAEQLPPAALVLHTDTKQQLSYLLPPNQKIVIGRHPQCQIVVPEKYVKVSKRQAEIRPILNSDGNTTPLWQIWDQIGEIKSSNGTYINGQKLQGCHTLQSGDRITLAYASECDRSPEFIFECQSNSDSASDKLDKHLTDCDILCLVVNPNQPLSIDEKQLLEKASKTYISKSIIIFDVPTPNTHLPELITANIAETEAWLHQNSNLSVELACLSLSPFYSNVQATVIDPEQQKSDKFHEFLEVLAKREGENIITKRVLGQLQAQIALFERVFTAREEVLIKLQQQEEKLLEVGQSELKDKIKNSLKQVNKDKEKTFKQIKNDLSQSKAALLDEYAKKSVYHKIETFVDNLQPFVAKRQGFKFVRLQSETIKNGGSVNLAINNLCQSNLREWGTEEWERISNTYAEGGLNGLFQRTYATLNFIPSLKLPASLLQPIQNVDIYRILQESIVEAPDEISYQDISLVGYLLKSIRSNAMTLGIILSVLGLFGVVVNKNEIIKGVLNSLSSLMFNIGIPPAISIAMSLAAIIFPFSFLIALSYDHDKTSKLEEAAAKLKKEVSSYYQSLAKSLAEKIVQKLKLEIGGRRSTA